MITDILELTPEFGFQETIEYRTLIDTSETGEEVRDALVDDGLREFKLTLEYRNQTYIDTIWDFYIARQGATDDFLIKIITDFSTTDEPIGTGDGTTRQFLLHNFPVDTSTNNSMKINGIANINYVLSNDTANEKSYVTFSTAPALGEVLTGSYEYYFRVRFKEDKLTRELMNYKLLNMGIELKEVRWNTYFPYSGNSSSSSSSSSFSGIETRWYALSGKSGDSSNYGGIAYGNWNGNSQVYQSHIPRKQGAPQVVPSDMVITGMIFYLDTAPGSGKKRVFTLYLNDEPTPLTLTISGSNKTGRGNAHVSCTTGDYVYLREDQHNTPAETSISWGASFITNHPKRYPILGNGTYHAINSYHPVFQSSWINMGSFFYSYPNDEGIGGHSLITSPGYLINLQLRHYRIAGISFSDTCKLFKKVGTNKVEETGVQAILAGSNITASDPINFCRVEAGDLVTIGHSFFYVSTMTSIEFVPDNPKESIHGAHDFSSHVVQDANGRNKFDSMHGWFAPVVEENIFGVEQHKELFTLCPIEGKIKNITFWALSFGVVPGFPLIYTIRKNGQDTSLVATLTSTVEKVTIEGCLSVIAGDRISVKISPSTQPASGSQFGSNFALGWTFVSANGGEWPIFGNFKHVY